MPKHSFVYTLVITILLIVWMVAETLGAAKAAPNTNMVPLGEINKPYAIAGYSVGMPIDAAEQNCHSLNNTKIGAPLNYAWVNHVDPDFVFCVIDPKKIIPPRAHQPTSAYRYLQANPAIVAIKHAEGTVRGLFIIYFEPEAWIIEKDRLDRFPVVRVKTKRGAEGIVDTSFDVRYNKDNDSMLSAFVMEPNIDFDIIEIDAAHKFAPKERIYALDYALKGLK